MKILVPVDGSLETKKAAEQAVSIAKKDGSSVTFLSVIMQDCNLSFSDTVNTKEYVLLQVEMLNIRVVNTKKMLDEMIESLRCADIDLSIRIAVGFPHPEIINAAKGGSYDLIVLGYRGLNALKRLLLGYVTKRVVINAPCSVLVIK